MPQIKPSESYQLPWYDSGWLSCYIQAREIVKSFHPKLLKEFEQSFEILRTDTNFQQQKVTGLISNGRIKELKQLISKLSTEQLEKHELINFGRFVVHDHWLFDQLQQELTAELSTLANEPLEPSYNFLALYNNLGYCQPHMDAPNAKWTLDICIEQSQEWPIYFSQIQPWPEHFGKKGNQERDNQWPKQIIENQDNQFTEYRMQEGEALFFSGSSQWHYRPRIQQKIKQNYCNLLFLHYIPQGTGDLVNPNKWSEIFSIPEFSHISFDLDRTD